MPKKRPIIGYKTFAGLHLILCQAAIDAVTRIRYGDKTMWEGEVSSGQINVNKPDLFGGEGKEGGVSGTIDVLDGASDQLQNDYLQTALDETNIPAFRGVVSLVFRKFYLTNNPFLKKLWVQVRAIYSTHGNWYPEKAPVNPEYCLDGDFIYVALDNSASMYPTNAPILKSAAENFIEGLRGSDIEIKMVAFSDKIDSEIHLSASESTDYDELVDWINGLSEPATEEVDIAPTIANAITYSNAAPDTPPLVDDPVIFDPDAWPSSSIDNVSKSPFGDAHTALNREIGELHMYIDISSFATGQAFTYQDTMVVESSGFTTSFNDSISISGLTTAEAQAGSAGVSLATRNDSCWRLPGQNHFAQSGIHEKQRNLRLRQDHDKAPRRVEHLRRLQICPSIPTAGFGDE